MTLRSEFSYVKYILLFNLVYFKDFLTVDQVSHTQLSKIGNEQAGTRTVGFGGGVLFFLISIYFLIHRMQNAGIPCPQVVILKKHVLVMSFIGQDQVPAPKLKDVTLSSEDMKKAYYQILNVSQC